MVLSRPVPAGGTGSSANWVGQELEKKQERIRAVTFLGHRHGRVTSNQYNYLLLFIF
jgi:hypothetical protein